MNFWRQKPYSLALLCIILLAVALRLAYLSQPMRYDEAFTFLRFADRPLAEGLTRYDAPNNHLFHTLLVHITTSIFGDSPWAIRLPAFLAGIALVPLVYVVTRQHYNAQAGLLAAGLTASSSVLVEFSTNARGYTLVCCLFVALLGLAHTLKQDAPLPPASRLSPPLHRMERGSGGEVERKSGLRVWLTFAILAAIGLYTIPTMLYPLGIVIVWLVLSIWTIQPRRTRLFSLLLTLLLTACLTLLLYLPVIAVSGLDSLTGNSWVQPVPWQYFPTHIRVASETVWLIWNRDIPVPVQALLVVGFLASLVYHRRIATYPIPVLLAALLWLIPMLLILRAVGFPRTWLFLLPLYFMIASAGVVYLAQIFVRRLRLAEVLGNLLKQQQGEIVGAHPCVRPTGLPNYSLDIIYPVMALLLCAILSLSVIQNQSVLTAEETGALPGAETFTRLLQGQLQADDGIVALRPADAPLEYYFRQYGMNYPNTDLANKLRLFIVVYEPASTVEATMAQAGLSMSNYTAPQRIHQIGSAALYLLVNQTLT